MFFRFPDAAAEATLGETNADAMRSTPPRDSGWVLRLTASTSGEEKTHPLPRGGTDFIINRRNFFGVR